MVLVFILFAIVAIITLLICMILLSTFRININHFGLTNIKDKQKNIAKKYQIVISLYLFNKIKWISIRTNDKKIRKMNSKINLEKIDLKKLKGDFEIEDLKQIKKLNPKISYLDLSLKIGVEDAVLTSYIIFLISTIISVILSHTIKKYEKDKYKYIILPLYINKNVYEIKFDCIIEIKMVHIINIIYYFLKKRRGRKYEQQRTSNRRSYGYSYE